MNQCGFQSFCGRPAHHRGQHGGWRTGARIILPSRVDTYAHTAEHEIPPMSLSVVAEYLKHGNFKEVGTCLGIAEKTAKNHAARAIYVAEATSTPNVAYLLGWIKIPNGLGHPEDFEKHNGTGI